jgi:hypothetical protein
VGNKKTTTFHFENLYVSMNEDLNYEKIQVMRKKFLSIQANYPLKKTLPQIGKTP